MIPVGRGSSEFHMTGKYKKLPVKQYYLVTACLLELRNYASAQALNSDTRSRLMIISSDGLAPFTDNFNRLL